MTPGMTPRRVVLLAGIAALLIGILALLMPVSTADGNGGSIGCGNGFAADMSAARDANDSSVAGVPILNQVVPHTDFVAQCQSEISGRRAWAIPVAVLGLLMAGGSMFVGDRRASGIGERR